MITVSSANRKNTKRLLLVEDMILNRAFIRNWLEHQFSNRLDIVDAANGKEALDRYQEALDNHMPFDVVLMDISMPIMDGFACLQEMIKLYGKNRPPTIAITTGAEQENPAGEDGPNFDGWWDKCNQASFLKGMGDLMKSFDAQ